MRLGVRLSVIYITVELNVARIVVLQMPNIFWCFSFLSLNQ